MTAAQDPASPAEEPLWPGYALPPFHPAYAPGPRGTPDVPAAPAADRAPAPGGPGHPPSPRPRPRRRRRLPDGAAVSGLLAALCVASLLAAIGLTALRARC